jgi:DegV family protein with EDD domain
MEKVKIIADSTCDLSEELLNKYDVSIIPLCVILGEETYQDGVDITTEDIYKWSEKNNDTPKTAAPLLNDVIDYIKPFTEKNMYILFFGISEEMSSTCNVIRLACDFLDYKKVNIINSRNLSTGIGLQVLKAASYAAEGYDAEKIVSIITDTIQDKVKASFIVDTLTYLQRGGRCSSVTAFIGNTLQLKPMIVVKDGKMGVGKKYRGANKKVLLQYVKDLKPELLKADRERVFITHSGCEEEVVRDIYGFIYNLHIFTEILITNAGGVVASHCGPKTLGVLFITKE